jgi:hypothetical protein
LGYGIGTLSMGMLADRYEARTHHILAACGTAMAICGALIPAANSRGAIACLWCVQSLAGGLLDCGGNVLIVKAWGEHKGGASAMNALHAAWSVGSVLSPALASYTGLRAGDMPRTWLVASAVSLASGLAVLVVDSPRSAPPATAPDQTGESADVGLLLSASKFSPWRLRFILACMGGFYFCYAGAEHLPGDWVTTAVTMPPISRSASDGAFATAVFWGALLAGRLAAIPIALFVRPIQLVVGEFAISLLSCLAFVTVGQRDYVACCVSLAGLGVGLAALYPAGILISRQRAPITSTMISRFIAVGLVSTMTVPSAVGTALEGRPALLSSAEFCFVGAQLLCFISVALLPAYNQGEGVSATSTLSHVGPHAESQSASTVELQKAG